MIELFLSKEVKDVNRIVLGLYVIGVYFVTRKRNPVLRRGLIIAGFISLVLALVYFGPHLEMRAFQARTSTQRGDVISQTGHLIRILDVSIESKMFARDDVDSYEFTLETYGTRYEDQTDFWVARRDRILDQSCLKKSPAIAPNASVTCQVAFEVPIGARNGKLVFDGSDYKARADVIIMSQGLP